MAFVEEFLAATQNGSHPGCVGCAWNPQQLSYPVAYGRSCLRHGVNWMDDEKANSIQVAQDPGGTTPERTGLLCFVCNSASPTDNTATFNYALWQAGVSLSWDPAPGVYSPGDPYLRRHFWTNSMMHGAPRNSEIRKHQESARQKCAPMIIEEIRLLQPRVLIASGSAAAISFHEVGLLSAPWEVARRRFAQGAYREVRSDLASVIHPVTIFCTYHTSARAVSVAGSALYGERTEPLIEEQLATLPDDGAARKFLRKYSNLASARDRGMRALLLHWLDIGDAVRAVGLAANPVRRAE